MRRRRVPARRVPGSTKVRREASDLLYLEHVVTIDFPVRSARAYLQRHMTQSVRLRLVEAARGEAVGTVRTVEILHATGDRTWIRPVRSLPDGQAAGEFAPRQRVQITAQIEGAAAESQSLEAGDEIVLHVPVHGYMRFLPGLFQGEGPVQGGSEIGREIGGGTGSASGSGAEDEEPLRRLLFLFQQVTTSVSDRIDDLPVLTNPGEVDARFLPWLASWVGFDLDESLPVHQQRELVRRAIRLMRTRGTRAGIEDMVRTLTSAPVRIEERRPPPPMVLGRSHLLGGTDVAGRYTRGEQTGTYLQDGPANPTSFFTLRLEPRAHFAARFGERATSVIDHIVKVVSAERPSHVRFVVRFDDSLE